MLNKVSEQLLQGALMHWAMTERRHPYVLPNSTVIYPWECDLLTVTNKLLVHEFEVKISMTDYKRDAEKVWKHDKLSRAFSFPMLEPRVPNYFWYATTFDIEPPEYAGWVKVTYNERGFYYEVKTQKEAPRLNAEKLSDKKLLDFTRLLSWRISNIYQRWNGSPEDAIQEQEALHADA